MGDVCAQVEGTILSSHAPNPDRPIGWTDALVLPSLLREAALLTALGHGVRERALMELLEEALQRDSVHHSRAWSVRGGGTGVILIRWDLQELYCSASLLLLRVS